jgi:hypothetical protein
MRKGRKERNWREETGKGRNGRKEGGGNLDIVIFMNVELVWWAVF